MQPATQLHPEEYGPQSYESGSSLDRNDGGIDHEDFTQLVVHRLREAWARLCAHAAGWEFEAMTPSHDLCRRLAELVAATPDRKVHHHAPTIHRMLAECHFVEDGGDAAPAVQDHVQRRQVRVLVMELEQVRLEALRDGRWASMPAAPPMCG